MASIINVDNTVLVIDKLCVYLEDRELVDIYMQLLHYQTVLCYS